MGEFKDFPYITADADTLGGKPRIKGTRISVAHVLAQLSSGHTVADLIKGYPGLSREAIRDAIRYAASLAHNETYLVAG